MRVWVRGSGRSETKTSADATPATEHSAANDCCFPNTGTTRVKELSHPAEACAIYPDRRRYAEVLPAPERRVAPAAKYPKKSDCFRIRRRIAAGEEFTPADRRFRKGGNCR